jgi:hypothetical protein
MLNIRITIIWPYLPVKCINLQDLKFIGAIKIEWTRCDTLQ